MEIEKWWNGIREIYQEERTSRIYGNDANVPCRSIKNSSIDKRKQNFEITQMEKSKEEWFRILPLLNDRGKFNFKERNGVISACRPFATRHAYFSFLFTSRALIVQLVAHLYATLQLFQVWSLARKEGGRRKKNKRQGLSEGESARWHSYKTFTLPRGNCHGNSILFVREFSKTKINIRPIHQKRKAGNISVLTLQFSHIRAYSFDVSWKNK